MELQSGSLIAEQYEIVKLLGRGGFGIVYLALDHKLGREVALKMVLPNADMMGEAFVRRFRREIDVIRKLEHPNVVRLYDFGEFEGVPFMVMELVRGVELSDYLTQNGALSWTQARTVMLQMLDGLYAAHQLDIVHRDLKPNNLMLTQVGMRNDFVKILDFGIAKAVHATERDTKQTFQTKGQIVGTPSYMAPEMLRQEEVSSVVDIYSAGLIFAELLTGKPVLEGTMIQVMAAHIDPRPHALPPVVLNSPFANVILRAVAKDARERFRDAREMYQAVECIPLGADATGAVGMVPTTGRMGGVVGPTTPANLTPQHLPPYTGPIPPHDLPEEERRGGRGLLLVVLALIVAVLAGGGVLTFLYLNNRPSTASGDSEAKPAQASADVVELSLDTANVYPTPPIAAADVATPSPDLAASPEVAVVAAIPDVVASDVVETAELGSTVVAVADVASEELGAPEPDASEPPVVDPAVVASAEQSFDWKFTTEPAGAVVRVGDERCTTPCSLQVARGDAVKVKFNKDKFKPSVRTIEATREGSLHVTLERKFRGL